MNFGLLNYEHKAKRGENKKQREREISTRNTEKRVIKVPKFGKKVEEKPKVSYNRLNNCGIYT